jgi:secondary thiamine-phosphate synthase enzyme
MIFKEISVRSFKREELINITDQIRQFANESGCDQGKLTIFIPHTTAAVTVNENADPDVPEDMIFALNKLVPQFREFNHLEGNSDAHVKSSLIGCSQDILIRNGKLVMGTWQGIFFCEFDGPRNRKVILSIQ